MHVASTTARRIFSDAQCHPILSRILVHCLEEHGDLSQVCRNVRYLLQTDLVIRDRLFQLMYSLPPPPRSLDGPLPSRPNDPRTPHDTEAFLREQALQRFSPALVRCVHAMGPIVAVRDGYMVTLSHKAQGGDKQHATGWAVWALPLWHEVRRSCVTKRDEAKSVRADPIDLADVPLPPRPSGATKDQRMWMWEFDLGKDVVAVAIQPEDNLIAVAVAPITVYYASGDDKNDADHFRLGRRHRVYFFRLRPPGLGMSYATEYGKPVRHCEAPRPFVDFIEPINANSANDDVQYTLKAGPDGLVALLVKPDGKKAVASGPLCVWDWRHGDCVGVAHTIPEAGRILDFDFLTSKQLIALEVTPCAENDARGLIPPVIPHRCRLTVLQLSSLIPRNRDVVYHSTRQPPSQTFHHFVAHNCWTLDDYFEDNIAFVMSLELPPMLDKRIVRSPTSVAAVFGSISIFPPLCEDMPSSQVSFTAGCYAKSDGVYTSPNTVFRGAIASAMITDLIPQIVVAKTLREALAKWQLYINTMPKTPLIVNSELCQSLERGIVAKFGERKAESCELNADLFEVSFDGPFRFTQGRKLFEEIVAAADATKTLEVAGGSARQPQPATLYVALGGRRGVEEHAKAFANFLPPLSTTRKELTVTEFRQWCTYADIEVLPPTATAASFADRVVYTDASCPTRYSMRKNISVPGPDTGKADASFTLVMRNYSLAVGCFPQRYSMDAARWYWPSKGEAERERQTIPNTSPARYVKCSCPHVPGTSAARGVHKPWLGEEVVGSSMWASRKMNDAFGGDKLELDSPYCETRVVVACARGGVQSVWFDGQTIVLSHGDVATLLCF